MTIDDDADDQLKNYAEKTTPFRPVDWWIWIDPLIRAITMKIAMTMAMKISMTVSIITILF